jgi:hypothetical protein
MSDGAWWSRLHDATLVAVTTEWKSGETRIRLRLGGGRAAEIVIAATHRFQLSREQPWGPSVSINEARLAPGATGRVRLEIELQNGDVIVAEGEHIDLRLACSEQGSGST